MPWRGASPAIVAAEPVAVVKIGHELRRQLAAARRRGWLTIRAGPGGLRLEHPAGARVILAAAPHRGEGVRRLAAELARVEQTIGRRRSESQAVPSCRRGGTLAGG
jgi:hypothetical protein